MGNLEVRPWRGSGAGTHAKVVERQRGLPVVARQELLSSSRQRSRIGPGAEGPPIHVAVQPAAPPRDREMVAAVGFNADIAALGLAPGAVLVLPADDRERVLPPAEDQDVPRRDVAALVRI